MKLILSKNAAPVRQLLARLKSNVSGNVLPMMGAAVIPLVAMIGGGIEASRIYMAKTRLQQACDAGALAGRKVMASGLFTSSAMTANGGLDARGQAQAFFKSNFAEGTFGAENITATYVESDKQVEGSASANLPMMIMKVFGFEDLTISTVCKAELSLTNTDVMFVLDTTGSMDQKASSGDALNKIGSLREAVLDFYDEMDDALPANSQLRYGFVPYAMNVNVGKLLYAHNPSWLVTDTWTYQSRKYFPEVVEAAATPATWDNPSATTWSGSSTDSAPQSQTWVDVSGASAVFGSQTLSNPNASATTQSACSAVNSGNIYVGTYAANGAPTEVNGTPTIDPVTGVKTTPVVRTQNYRRTDYQYVWRAASGGGSGGSTTYAYTRFSNAEDKIEDLNLDTNAFDDLMDDLEEYKIDNPSNGTPLLIANWLLNKSNNSGNNHAANIAAIRAVIEAYRVAQGISWRDRDELTGTQKTALKLAISTYITANPASTSGSTGQCVLQTRGTSYDARTNGSFTQAVLTWNDPVGTPEKWLYAPLEYNVSSYVAGNTVNIPVGTDGANVASTWDGCIEERSTVALSSFGTLPSDAYDLDINLVPNSKETRWRPYWPEATFMRDGVPAESIFKVRDRRGDTSWPSLYGHPTSNCSYPAQRLAEMERDAVEDYLDNLQPDGYTYHDIGVLWGARLLSPNGLFASDNRTTPYGEPISRHLIFMTDGQLVTGNEHYISYGTELMDEKITGGSLSTKWDRHNDRYKAICREARKQGMTIWAVGFGVTVPDAMYECAGDDPANKTAATHTFQADDAAQLKTQFRKIASQIAQLRLGA